MASSDLILSAELLQEWHEQLKVWARTGELTRATQEALHLDGSPEQLQRLVREWSEGDFSHLPPVVLLPGSAMPGAAGAYAISTGTIYLNAEWLQSADQSRVLAVLAEELGHHLDGLLNRSDSQGDEGNKFSNAVTGGEQLETQADSNYNYSNNGMIYADSTWVNAEFSADYQPFTSRIISIADLAFLGSSTLDGNSILIGGRSSVADNEIPQANATFGYIGSIGSFANSPTWSQLVPSSRGEMIYDIQITSEGDIYTLGRSLVGYDTNTFSQFRGPYYDVTLSKYDPSGGLKWSRTTGNFLWNNPQSAAPDYPSALAMDAAGNVYITGTTMRVVASNPFGVSWGDPTGFVVSYTTDGNFRWSTLLGSEVEPVDIVAHSNGDIYITGTAARNWDRHSFLSRLHSTNGVSSWLHLFGAPPAGVMAASTPDSGNALAVDQSGMVYIAGTSTNTPVGDIGYVAKFNPEGISEWIRFLFPGQEISTAKSITIDSSGKVYVFGEAGRRSNGPYSSWSKDLYTAALVSSGNHIVYSLIETSADEVAQKVMAGQDESIFTIGSFFDSSGKAQVVIGSNTSNTGFAAFAITGIPVVGNTLTATNRTPDPDGNGAFVYTWQTSADGSSWSNVGSNSNKFTIAPSDQGKQIRLKVDYTDGKGFAESIVTGASQINFIQTLSHGQLEILAKDIVYQDSHTPGSLIDAIPDFPYKVSQIWPNDDGFYALGLIAPNAPSILVIRGTTPGDKFDLWDDLNVNGIGNSQFAKYRDELKIWLQNQDSSFPPIITGHSLGGAIAQWIAADVTFNPLIKGQRLGEVVTFNSPGIAKRIEINGKGIGAETFDNRFAGKVTHYITSADYVSLGGESYIQGYAKLYDYESYLDVVGPHLVPVESDLLPISKLPKPTGVEQRNLSFSFLDSQFFNYLDDLDFVAQRIGMQIIATKVAAGTFIPYVGVVAPAISALITSINAALTFRLGTERIREIIGNASPEVLDIIKILFSASSIAAEVATDSVQSALRAFRSGGIAATAAFGGYTQDVLEAITEFPKSAWDKISSFTDDAWKDTTGWSLSTWLQVGEGVIDIAKPFIPTAIKRKFFLSLPLSVSRLAIAANSTDTTDLDHSIASALFRTDTELLSQNTTFVDVVVSLSLSQVRGSFQLIMKQLTERQLQGLIMRRSLAGSYFSPVKLSRQ